MPGLEASLRLTILLGQLIDNGFVVRLILRAFSPTLLTIDFKRVILETHDGSRDKEEAVVERRSRTECVLDFSSPHRM